MNLFEILVHCGLCESKTKAKKLIEQGACRINGVKTTDPFFHMQSFLLDTIIEVGPKHKNNSAKFMFVNGSTTDVKANGENIDIPKLKVFIEDFSKLKEFYILINPFYQLMSEKYFESSDKEWYIQYLLDCRLDNYLSDNKHRNKQELTDFYKNKTEHLSSIIINLETASRELSVIESKSHPDLKTSIADSGREIRKIIRELSSQVEGHRWCIRNIEDVFNNHKQLRYLMRGGE